MNSTSDFVKKKDAKLQISTFTKETLTLKKVGKAILE